MPPLAGLFSAAGLLFARAEFHDVRFCRVSAREPDLSDAAAARRRDAARPRRAARARRRGRMAARQADVRYRGQNWSVTVDFPGAIDDAAAAALVERFEDEHERLYGTRLDPGSPVDVRAVRLIALGPPRTALRCSRAPEPAAAARRPPHRRLRAAPRHARGAGAPPRVARSRAGRRPAADRRVRHDGRRSAGLDGALDAATRRARARARRGRAPRRGRRRARGVDRAAARRQRARDRCRRDGDDDLPHRALGGRPRRDGLLGGALRPDRRRRSRRR